MKRPQRILSLENMILETKLLPPTLKEKVINRPRILNLLDQNLNRKLILIVTDAGYGKTTLLTQYIKEHNLSAVYYSLDSKDSGLLIFFSYLIRGLERIDPNLVTQIKSLFQGGGQIIQHYELFMGSLINEIMNKTQKEIYIILDDYHNLAEDSLVHKALNYFIDHVPDKIRVIISSRVIPPLGNLAKWRAKQNLFEIYRDGLRFTEDEIKELFSAFYDKTLTHEAIKMVSDKTDGWITGIQLILYSTIKDRIIIEQSINEYNQTRQPLFDYFTKEIFEAESPAIQDFLKRSSIMEIMSPADCNHILRIRNARALLQKIENRNLFLSAVGKGEYKYHPLFREFLNRRLEEEKGSRELHERAARYYETMDEWELVVEHCLAAANYQRAAEIVFLKADSMLDQARHDLLNEWLRRMPESFFLQYPRLVILQGRLLQEKGFPTKANELFNQAEKILRKSGINKKKNLAAWIETLYERGNLFMSEGHYREALKYLKKALQACPASAKKFRGDILNLTGLVWDGLGNLRKSRLYLLRAKKLMDKLKVHCSLLAVECNLTLLLEKQGEAKILHEMHKPLLEKLRADYCWRTGYIFINAALNALEMGNEEWAENCLNEGLNLCQIYHDPKTIAGIYMGLGALSIAQENWERARNYLDIAVDAYQKIGWPKKTLNLCFSRFYRFQQDYDNMKKILKTVPDNSERELAPIAISLGIENALYEMAQGNLDKAREIIKRALNLTRVAGWKKEEFLSLLADAELSALEHRDKEALRKIDQALALAKIKGYDGLLKCELRYRPKLWNLVLRLPGYKSYAASLRMTPQAPVIQVRLLGGLSVRDDKGRPISVKWPSEKTRSLFTYMVIHREMPVHRELLLEQIWPGMEPARANVNFRNTATRLRQALLYALDGQVNKDEIFTFKHKKYQLLSGVRIKVDTEEFDRIVKEAGSIEAPDQKVKHITMALELYKGDFLPENYDSWTDIHRQRLKENFLNNLHWLAGYAARVGDNDGCISACEKYLAHEPFSEEISRLCMQVLVRLGRLGAVKNRYEQLKRALRQVLRSAPSKETREFYKSLISSQSDR